MAPVILSTFFFIDRRVDFLATLLGEEKVTTIGRLALLFHHLKGNNLDVFNDETVRFGCLYAGDRKISAAMVKCEILKWLSEDKYELTADFKQVEEIPVEQAEFQAKNGDQKAADVIPLPKKQTDYEFIVQLWNEKVAPMIGRPTVSSINPERKRFMDRMLKEFKNDRNKIEIMMLYVPRIGWVAEGRVTFTFETVFRNNNYLKFYEEAVSETGEDVMAARITDELPKMQPVLTQEELEGRM